MKNYVLLLINMTGRDNSIEIPEKYITLERQSIFSNLTSKYLALENIEGMVVVASPEWMGYVSTWIPQIAAEKPLLCTEGSGDYAGDVMKGLEKLSGTVSEDDGILIHEVINPFVNTDDINNVTEKLESGENCVALGECFYTEKIEDTPESERKFIKDIFLYAAKYSVLEKALKSGTSLDKLNPCFLVSNRAGYKNKFTYAEADATLLTADTPERNNDQTMVVVLDSLGAVTSFNKHFRVNRPVSSKIQWIIYDRSMTGKGVIEDEGGEENDVAEEEGDNKEDDSDVTSLSENEQPVIDEEDEEMSEEEIAAYKYYNAVLELMMLGVEYHEAEDETTFADIYNDALGRIKGSYVCFTNQYVYYDQDMFDVVSSVAARFPGADIISSKFWLREEKNKHKKTDRYGADKVVLNEQEKLYIFPYACFFRADAIKDYHFEAVCEEETLLKLELDLLAQKGEMVLLRNAYCSYKKKLSRASDKYYGCASKEFYNDSLKGIYIPLVDKFVSKGEPLPDWLKREVFYRIYFKFYANLNLRNKFLLNHEETEEFFSLSAGLLKYVDDSTIIDNVNYEQFAPPFSLRTLFLMLKYDGDEKALDRSFMIEEEKLYCIQRGIRYDMSNHLNVKVMALNLRNGKLCVDARFFTHMLYDFAPDAIYAELNGERIEVSETKYYALQKVFGVSVDKSYCYYIEFPLDCLKEGKDIRIAFYISLNGVTLPLTLSFFRAPSKLNNSCPHTHWMLDDEHVLTRSEKEMFISAYNRRTLKKLEKVYVKEAIEYLTVTNKKRKIIENRSKNLKYLRKKYFSHIKKFRQKRVWLYFDKLYKAGDNGEYAFRYTYYNDPTIECYYVVNESAPDYERLVKEFGDRILTYGSRKCMLYALLAETIIATHPDIIEFFGYGPQMTSLMKDLFNPWLVCIAHGVTIQKNADYQNRLFDNTMFYTTSSKYEVKHITHPIYGYHDDEVALTGMARFDGLKNADQKQILITPTWRRNLVGSAKRNTARAYKNTFKTTDYFKIYNSLINDERIIETAKETGYRVIFLLHPSMSTQIDDYDRNDYVELIPASGDMSYEKILTESSLMITDYSGIHYDFGYMRKPVIYYQPKEVPMRFEEGGMKFETMGFGPVCTEYEDAVSLICEYMRNACVMPDEYRAHADDFFAFDDFDNSKRIIEAVKAWIARQRKM